jgi:hypothetical protein
MPETSPSSCHGQRSGLEDFVIERSNNRGLWLQIRVLISKNQASKNVMSILFDFLAAFTVFCFSTVQIPELGGNVYAVPAALLSGACQMRVLATVNLEDGWILYGSK